MASNKSIEAEKKFDKTSETQRLSPIGSARSEVSTTSGSYTASDKGSSDREQTPIDV